MRTMGEEEKLPAPELDSGPAPETQLTFVSPRP